MEKKLYELPTIVIFDLDKNNDIVTASGPLSEGGEAGYDGSDGEDF